MPIRVKCESCKKTLSVKEHLAGKKIKCPVCQNVVVIPTASPTKEPAGAGPSAATPKKLAPPKPPAAPSGKSGSSPAAKKPSTATKPVQKTKPTVEKPNNNGTPAAKAPSGNGAPSKPAEPETVERPPEDVDAEALAAFADEPKPPEETEEPKTIDFVCDWCDEKVSFPIEMAGKQMQCPNKECGRIIKVPLPKKVEKKDWRKMDTKGPAMARINQPEQLADAWGTEEATKARQDSLKQAGAIEEPPAKRRDIFDVIKVACYVLGACAFLVVLIVGFWKMSGTRRDRLTIAEAKKLVEDKGARIKTPSIASGEAHRAIALLYLQSEEKDRSGWARDYFQGAQGAARFKVTKGHEAVNEQLFLIDLAVSQIEMGGDEEETFGKARLPWRDTVAELRKTLEKIESDEVRIMALRQVGSRLIAKKRPADAVTLTAPFAVDVAAKNKRLLPFRQQIAMIAAHGGDQKLPPSDPAATGFDGFARVGHAEGFARKGEFDAAMKLVQAPGSGKDRLDAALGAGAVFLETDKLKAAAFVGEAFKILGEKKIESTISEWQFLQLVKLAARTDKMDLAKNLAKLLSRDFAMRAHLEIFLATVDATNGFMEAEGLDEIENPDKKAPAKKEATAGDTIVLAWLAIARHNAQAGYGREATRRLLEERLKTWTPPGGEADVLRAIIDVGAYQGAKK